MGGRAPGSEGDRLAREYLADRLEESGFQPLFEGAWHQPFEIVGITTSMPGSWTFHAGRREVSFRFGEEFMAASGVQEPRVEIDGAELVFAGYGIEAPEEGWDDFGEADLEGKILLLLNDDPDWDPALFAGERKLYYGRWSYKYESAARQGAAGAILIHTTPSAGYGWTVVRNSWSGEQFQLPRPEAPAVPLQAWLTESAARRLVAAAGFDLDELVTSARSTAFRPRPLGIRTSIAFDVSLRKTSTANTAGFLPGADPGLARQHVVFSAHHDHLGVRPTRGTADAIYNGAVDNAVAMAQLLEIGAALTAREERPARSVTLLFPAAEEQGLLGSSYFVESGAVPPREIAANINLELGNVWGPTRDVTIFGKGKSTLEDLLEDLARGQGRTVTEERDLRAGWYYRSDQFSFARAGVPSIWFRSGTHFRDEGMREQDPFARWIEERYHQPGDEVQPDWDLRGLSEDAELAFRLGLKVASEAPLPSWYEGDEFERIRAESLAGQGEGLPETRRGAH